MNEALKLRYGIATPHQEIREGRLAEAVYAARTVGEPIGNAMRSVQQAGWVRKRTGHDRQ